MVHGQKCPVCKSTNTGDGDMRYTYDKISKVYATWTCEDCNAMYTVIYKAECIEVIPWSKEFDDLDEDKEYVVQL